MTTNHALQRLSSDDLRAATRALVGKSCCIEADLLAHLAEIDERKLYNEWAYPSMFAFCVDELGFSDDAAFYRITVARAASRFPAILDAVRSGRVHLAGLRLLVPHLTQENHRELLERAAGKSKRQIEELAACLAPRPPVPDSIRPLPVPPVLASPVIARSSAAALSAAERSIVEPLSADAFRIEFTASRAFRDKLREAQDLLRHRVPDGSMAEILERALDLLIERVTKERFATGRKARPADSSPEPGPALASEPTSQPEAEPSPPSSPPPDRDPDQGREQGMEQGSDQVPQEPIESPSVATSRHIPDPIKRAVYERDGGRCTFTDEQGRRCEETSWLEFDHEDGFACTHLHDVRKIRLLCRAHNQYTAEKRYGRDLMERARGAGEAARPGASPKTKPS